MKFISSPYTHPIAAIREERAEAVMRFAAHCELRGYVVYSPIAAWHGAAKLVRLPTDWSFWWRHNRHMLRHAHEVFLLCLDGWEDSHGVQAELELADTLGLPYRRFDTDFVEVV